MKTSSAAPLPPPSELTLPRVPLPNTPPPFNICDSAIDKLSTARELIALKPEQFYAKSAERADLQYASSWFPEGKPPTELLTALAKYERSRP